MNKIGDFKRRVYLGSLKPGVKFRLVNLYHKRGSSTVYEVVDFVKSSFYEIAIVRVCESKHISVGTTKFMDVLDYVWI